MRPVLLFAILLALLLTAGAQEKRSRVQIITIEEDGFLGLRLGNNLRSGEDQFGEPSEVGNGKRVWRFRSADYDPVESLTALADKGTITDLVVSVRPDRVTFSYLKLEPQQNRFAKFQASRSYKTGGIDVLLQAEGEDATYVRKIRLTTKIRS